MKDKERITLMVCTSATGAKVPLAVVGKPENPHCFRDTPPVLPYCNQSNAWFDGRVFDWWLVNVFAVYVKRKHGERKVLLLLDNFEAHKHSKLVPSNIILHFFPPNLTSRHQPADMGMIASLKYGYKYSLLLRMIDVVDTPEKYTESQQLRAGAKRGRAGIKEGAKPTLSDCMIILRDIWNDDSKYATEDGIKRCWTRANCLGLFQQITLVETTYQSSRTYHRHVNDEDVGELCKLVTLLAFKCKALPATPAFVQDSLCDVVSNSTLTREELAIWIDAEDDPVVQDAIIDAEMEASEERVQKAAAATADSGPEIVDLATDIAGSGDSSTSSMISAKEVQSQPSYAEFVAAQALIQNYCSQSSLKYGDCLLDAFENFKEVADDSIAKRPKIQTTLRDYFHKQK